MGWASATDIVDNVWNIVKEHIPEDQKVKVGLKIVSAFEAEDWDTQDESALVQELLDLDDNYFYHFNYINEYHDKDGVIQALADLNCSEERTTRLLQIWEQRRGKK